jgi:quinol monooxygenase YgiN
VAEVWTHGRWLVRPGKEDEFVAAWSELADWTVSDVPNARGILFRDREQPNLFYSFGPWEGIDAVERWRASEGFAARIERIRGLVDTFEPHTLDPVARVGGF